MEELAIEPARLCELLLNVIQLEKANAYERLRIQIMPALYEALVFKLPKHKALPDQPGQAKDVCLVCYCTFDDDDGPDPRQVMTNCGHMTCCRRCIVNYQRNEIEQGSCMPWLLCAHENCKVPIHIQDCLPSTSPQDAPLSALLCKTVIRKHLARTPHSYWRECSGDSCSFGFLVDSEALYAGLPRQVCAACGLQQDLPPQELDAELQKMVDEGKMKPCPSCKWMAIKDFGMCNVMTCAKCATVWHWRTLEMANSVTELKHRARSHGTLWEKGELAYQQRLQRTDLPAFIALLARNGITYDPNFRRGSD